MAEQIEGRVSSAVDAWLRWLPRWHIGTARGRTRPCRMCLGSPVATAAGFDHDVPHAVQHALLNRMRQIVDDDVDEYTARNLPLVTRELVERCLAALKPGVDGAIAAAPMTDTVKEAQGGLVTATLDRSRLWAVQTPQAFRRDWLERALAVDDALLARATDDAWLVERAGGRVRVVESTPRNLKVTSAEDFRVAELLLEEFADR